MTDAQKIADLFGGQRALARALDVSPSTVNRWCNGFDPPHGTGGIIPRWHHESLRSKASAAGIKIERWLRKYGR